MTPYGHLAINGYSPQLGQATGESSQITATGLKSPHPPFGHPLPCVPHGRAPSRHPRVGGDPPVRCPQWIPAFAGMTKGRSGNDASKAPLQSRHPRAGGIHLCDVQWIPAFAGMTKGRSGNDASKAPLQSRHPRAGGDPPLRCPQWIPAFAGMTELGEAGMTELGEAE